MLRKLWIAMGFIFPTVADAVLDLPKRFLITSTSTVQQSRLRSPCTPVCVKAHLREPMNYNIRVLCSSRKIRSHRFL